MISAPWSSNLTAAPAALSGVAPSSAVMMMMSLLPESYMASCADRSMALASAFTAGVPELNGRITPMRTGVWLLGMFDRFRKVGLFSVSGWVGCVPGASTGAVGPTGTAVCVTHPLSAIAVRAAMAKRRARLGRVADRDAKG